MLLQTNCGVYINLRSGVILLTTRGHDRRLGLHLKSEQEQAVRNLDLGKDVLAVLLTGFGKSRIYQGFSLLKSCENTGATLIIIAPLTSIMEDQLADLRSRGF